MACFLALQTTSFNAKYKKMLCHLFFLQITSLLSIKNYGARRIDPICTGKKLLSKQGKNKWAEAESQTLNLFCFKVNTNVGEQMKIQFESYFSM